ISYLPPSPSPTSTLSLHDALPIFTRLHHRQVHRHGTDDGTAPAREQRCAPPREPHRASHTVGVTDAERRHGRSPCGAPQRVVARSEEHTSELQSLRHLVCRLLLEK